VSLIFLSSAWIVGVLLGSWFSLPQALIAIGLIPLPLLLFRFLRYHKKLVILSSLCLALLFTGAAHFQSSQAPADESHIQIYTDRGTVEIKGLVNSYPELIDRTARLQVSAQEVNKNDQWREASGTVLVTVTRYPVYRYGDLLLLRGELESSADPGYADYLARQDIHSVMFYPEIEVMETGRGSSLLAWVYSLRERLSRTLTKVLPEPQASLAQGIILGIRENIPSSVRDSFIFSGTAHLLAISGLHLSVVAGILLSMGIWAFGRQGYIYVWLALIAIWLYALLTGMNPPVIRAGIMVSLFLIAELLGRQRSAITALAFAAAIMVGIEPQVMWSVSFQMSFTAIAGLIFIFPPLQSLGRRTINSWLGGNGAAVSAANFVVDSLSVTLAATIAIWPLVAHYFGIVSLVGPLATFFALPALPGIIIAGAIAGLVGLFALPVAQVIAWLAWLFLSYMLLVVRAFAAIPPIETGQVDIGLILGY
jgi:competence protein ComEC